MTRQDYGLTAQWRCGKRSPSIPPFNPVATNNAVGSVAAIGDRVRRPLMRMAFLARLGVFQMRLTRHAILWLSLLVLATSLSAAGVDKDNLKEYGRGIIKDYSDMKETDDIEWVWLKPGLSLSEYQVNVQPFENLTAFADDDMEDVFATKLPKTLTRLGPKDTSAPVLKLEGAIYWAQRANRSKWWIPYAGAHLAQAGVGIELVFTNAEGEVVCKIRHSGREGDQLENAAEELMDDVAQYIRAN